MIATKSMRVDKKVNDATEGILFSCVETSGAIDWQRPTEQFRLSRIMVSEQHEPVIPTFPKTPVDSMGDRNTGSKSSNRSLKSYIRPRALI